MAGYRTLFALLLSAPSLSWAAPPSEPIYLRANQLGYLPDDLKLAVAFSNEPLKEMTFEIVDSASGRRVWGPRSLGKNFGAWGNFPYHYGLDFTAFRTPGRYRLRIGDADWQSLPFRIGPDVYGNAPDLLLHYLRQQRCGYNPFLDEVCHRKDGRTVYGPMPDSTYIDVSGGWHDAADYLRYLLTSGNTVGRLLFAYRESGAEFEDVFDALGHRGANGVPDILDEARWGLDWMLKMHPASDQLFHQVADDRDHSGWDLPHQDTSDYGWGPGSYRVVYYATGAPQGLGRYQNESTGIANLAGRYAAAMAMAAEIWKKDLQDPIFAARCLKAAEEVYAMGKKQPGSQEGTPCLQPYRYTESTWSDDMEWGAAELFRATGDSTYLLDAKRYARAIAATSWMGADTSRHYEYYPFVNLGHFALFPFVDKAFQDTLGGYYQEGIEKVWKRAQRNPYRVGVPFIWCSNNLMAALVTQCLLFEKMTGDDRYHELLLAARDWLLGRNPWGVTAFVGIPRDGGEAPQHPHSVIAAETGRPITGGMVDGPVYASIFNRLKGVRLSREDRYAPFQSSVAVYHDDLWDYATNEPTLDGTAEALLFLSFFAAHERE